MNQLWDTIKLVCSIILLGVFAYYTGIEEGKKQAVKEAYKTYKKQIWNEHPVMMRQDTGIQHSCMKGAHKRRKI